MSVALFKRPKAPAPLSPERQALSAAIERVAAAKAAIQKAEETRSEAGDKIDAAEEALARVERAREKSATGAADYVRAIIAGETAAPPGLRRRVSLEDREAKAQRALEAWREVREATFQVEREQEDELRQAETALTAAVSGVVVAEAGGAVEALIGRLDALEAEAAAIRAVLHEYKWRGNVQRGDLGDRIKNALGWPGGPLRWAMADQTPANFERLPATVLARTMLSRLREDADAPLPTLDQLRGLADA